MELSLTRRFRVAAHEVGPNAEARPSAIMNLLQEVAGEHAASWRLGVPDLLPQGRTWVLSRYRLELVRPVRPGETLAITTWPSGRSAGFATRDFEVDDDAGAPVARATTSWAMLDLRAKRMLPVEEVVPPEFRLDRQALEGGFPSLPRLEASERDVALPVLLRDLDLNVHVNHTVYVQWAFETVPLELLRSHRLVGLDVGYRAEARHGDTVTARRGPRENADGAAVFLHGISRNGDGSELARLRTRWLPR